MREYWRSYFTVQNYSTVSFVRCGWVEEIFPADTFFCFTITVRRPILQMPHYTEYQYFLYETISKLREKGITFNQIADHLNKKKILSARGKKFKGGHVHSIIKRRLVRDKKLKENYPEVLSNFYLDIYDKSILFNE